jgi:hypothetical protein
MLIPTAAEQPQGVVQPIPTPSPPAEALQFPGRKPPNRSAFALTYILLRRSCKRTGAFIIHPCLPGSRRTANSRAPSLHGHYSSFLATMSPSATLSSSTDFLGSPVIRFAAPPISRRDEEGFSSCLAHPCHRAAANTPPECPTASVSCGGPCCLRPFGAGSAPGVFGFRGHLCVHFRCGPMTRSPSKRWLCRSASFASFPPRMRSKLQGPDSCPGRSTSY